MKYYKFIENEKLEEMVIEKELTMKIIYDELKKKEKEIKTKDLHSNPYILLNINNKNVTILEYEENYFSFTYNEILFPFF